MADFRRWFYALAVVALFAGLTVPVFAQPTPVCNTNAGVPPIVRAEGYTELVGDVILTCTGGIPTPPGQVVPPVNITILLTTNITSKYLNSSLGFDEALLIVDDPHSAVNPARPILNCGAAGAPDVGASGPGVCSIVATTSPALTYDGTPNIQNTTACSATYGCGRPNVFQGRIGTLQNPGQFNAVSFLGVPFDPPGTTTSRTLRITNVRADAEFLGVSPTFFTQQIQMNISVNGNTSLAINNPQQIVAYINKGLFASVATTNFTFLQCNDQNPNLFNGTSTTGANSPQPAFLFMEGFASSFKAKSIAHITNQTGNGILQPGNSYWSYDTVNTPTKYPVDQNQNVPGAIYNTESGFTYPSTSSGGNLWADPAAPNNPPAGVGTTPVTATTAALFSAYTGTGISGAGIASQGTRLALNFSSIPNGSAVYVPSVVFLKRQNNTSITTGVMVLTATDTAGAGAYSRRSSGGSGTLVAVGSSNLAVYEVLFADPFSLEQATVPIVVAYVANLAQNLPQPGVTAQVGGGFAPFYSSSSARQPSSTLPVPRFIPGTVPANVFSVSKCACNLLFPYVVSTAGFDTGIAIANTSTDPGSSFGFFATPQSGAIQFWYYGVVGTSAPPATQCTNTAAPGTCPGTTIVPSGQVMTYVASSGSTTWGLDNRAAGFVGYVIAQAQFQWCHAFAYISALGAGPLTPGASEGYLALVLDNAQINDFGYGLSRTGQAAENLVH